MMPIKFKMKTGTYPRNSGQLDAALTPWLKKLKVLFGVKNRDNPLETVTT